MSSQHELLIELLREVNQGIGRHVRKVFAENGFPFITGIIARQIENEPGITVSELARRTNIAKSHISNTIRDLCERGLVRKETDPADARLIRLYLTPEGKDRLQKARLEVRQRINLLIEKVPEVKASALIEGLCEIKQTLQEFEGKEKDRDD